jgi:hypothetical protein
METPAMTTAGRIAGGERLIDRFEVTCTAYCPCGSRHIHYLTLVSTSECARCGRTLGIRSIDYNRSGPHDMPDPIVSVGYLQTDAALDRRPTVGVH